MIKNLQVKHNETARRFETKVEGQLAIAEYERDGETVIFTHTEVPAALEGRGIGAQLVRTALDYARDAGWRVVPACSFVAAYIARHPEYQELSIQ